MTTDIIHIENLKCGGCAKTITGKVGSVAGVEKVHVSIEESTVEIQHNESVSRETVVSVLAGLGYPESGNPNGIFTKVRSYGSCLTGKLSNHD